MNIVEKASALKVEDWGAGLKKKVVGCAKLKTPSHLKKNLVS